MTGNVLPSRGRRDFSWWTRFFPRRSYEKKNQSWGNARANSVIGLTELTSTQNSLFIRDKEIVSESIEAKYWVSWLSFDVPFHSWAQKVHFPNFLNRECIRDVLRIGSISFFIWVNYEKSGSPYCVMLYFWWGFWGSLNLITLRSERVNKREYELRKLPLNSSFCAVTADSRWPHDRKAHFCGAAMSAAVSHPWLPAQCPLTRAGPRPLPGRSRRPPSAPVAFSSWRRGGSRGFWCDEWPESATPHEQVNRFF